MNSFTPRCLIVLFLTAVPFLSSAKFLPVSRHQQFQTYGLLLEDHTFVTLQTGGKSFNQIAGSMAFYEFENARFKPQIILSGTVNAAIRLAKSDIMTETADNYINLLAEFTVDETSRFFLGLRHQSGHVTEDVLNKELSPYNNGNEVLVFRYIKDLQGRFRVGGTFKPMVDSTAPKPPLWGSDQFFEWFPQGFAGSEGTFVPYVAGGLEQSGGHSMFLTEQLQVGLYAGNHHQPKHAPTVRLVLGFYNGVDPRLKYAQIKNTHAIFGYGGVMLNF